MSGFGITVYSEGEEVVVSSEDFSSSAKGVVSYEHRPDRGYDVKITDSLTGEFFKVGQLYNTFTDKFTIEPDEPAVS